MTRCKLATPASIIKVLIMLSILIGLSTPSVAHAACSGVTWSNPSGGDWGVGANWQGNAVPLGNEAACIDIPGVTVTIGQHINVGSLMLANKATLDIRSQLGSATSDLQAQYFVINDGTIILDAQNGGVDVGLGVYGAAGIQNNGDGIINILTGSGGTRSLSGNLTNFGTINVNDSLTLGDLGAPNTTTFTNNGTIKVFSGNVLNGGGGYSYFVQSGVALDIGSPDGFLWSGARFTYSNGAIPHYPPVLTTGQLNFGTSVTVTPIEIMVIAPGVELVNDIPLGAAVRVQGRSTITQTANLNLRGNYKNNGDIFLDSLSPIGPVSLNTSAAATLTNIGRILVINNPGGGQNDISGNVNNQGLVQVDGPLSIDSQALGMFTNRGSFTIGAGATVLVNNGPTLNDANYDQAAGKTLLSASSSTLAVNFGSIKLSGGTLSGLGTINANILNTGGTLSPGSSDGVMTLNGDYTQGAGSNLLFHIGGTTPGTGYDQLNVSGNLTLAADLSLCMVNGFSPPIDSSYQILTFGGRSGDFTEMRGLNVVGKNYTPAFSAHNLTLAITTGYNLASPAADCQPPLIIHLIYLPRVMRAGP